MATPTELVSLPDTELLVVNYLREQLDGVAEVGLAVPGDEDIFDRVPFVRVTRTSGPGRHRERLDSPVVDIDVWDTSNAAVNATGGLVRALMSAIRGYHDTDLNSVVTQAAETVGPQRLPEDNPQLVRLGFTVGLTVRPLPG